MESEARNPCKKNGTTNRNPDGVAENSGGFSVTPSGLILVMASLAGVPCFALHRLPVFYSPFGTSLRRLPVVLYKGAASLHRLPVFLTGHRPFFIYSVTFTPKVKVREAG